MKSLEELNFKIEEITLSKWENFISLIHKSFSAHPVGFFGAKLMLDGNCKAPLNVRIDVLFYGQQLNNYRYICDGSLRRNILKSSQLAKYFN
jgi:hypothetical protein